MTNYLESNCRSIASDIAHYLKNYLDTHHSFKLRSFYGESFTLNLLSRVNLLDDQLKEILISEYQKKNKEDPEFHFEFNNYALSDYAHYSHDQSINSIFKPLRFKGTPCTNWTLLRSNVKLINGIDIEQVLKDVEKKLSTMQEKSGLILDDPGVRSFQYHCFSSAMILEMYQITKQDFLKKSFLSSVAFIRKFILDNGEALYIGRGQEQSFGLGVLVYILACFVEITADQSALADIEKVLQFIKHAQRKDGSFPLVFTGMEQELPGNVDMNAKTFCGWYPYNNFFDYLPFMGFFVIKAADVLKSLETKKETEKKSVDYRDDLFIKVVQPNYTAVLSLPGGYWTNDLPMPLIYKRGKFVTPMLGGEQFQKSLYDLSALSMPMTKSGKSWRRYGRGFFLGNSIVWISIFGVMKRSFDFQNNKIKVTNKSLYWVPSLQYFSFLNNIQTNKKEAINDDLRVTFSREIVGAKTGYSAMGELKVLTAPMNVDLQMELL